MKRSIYMFVFVVIVIILGIVFLAYRSAKNEKEPINDSPSTVSSLSVVDDNSTASAISVGTKMISWQTSNYPKDVGVNINLVRKISDSPKQFDLVRTLAIDTPNDGKETWVPQNGETSNDLYIEVTCSTSYQFNSGCSLPVDPIKVK
jgi:hypothetical protein